MPDAPAPIELTAAEWSVIKAVWDLEPCTAPQVRERLVNDTQWTYSTVRTLLDRMVAKALLKAEKVGKLTWFRSAVTRDQARRGELLYALQHAFDGALTPMVQTLLDSQGISDADLDELAALIRQRRKRTRS